VNLAHQRIEQELKGTLKTRPMNRPVYDPVEAGNSLRIAPWTKRESTAQMVLLEKAQKKDGDTTR